MGFDLYLGNCLDILKKYPDNYFDSCVCDPPYGLNFMGKKWDYDVPKKEIWEEVFRVLKPGAHLLSFFGTRTYHRGVVNIEDAGFEIRDQIAWLYGQGFPKSQDVSKYIDKEAGVERTEKIGVKVGHENFVGRDKDSIASLRNTGALADGFSRPWMFDEEKVDNYHHDFAPVTDEAKEWDGWGTALKPALEPIVVARKPLSEKTVASNVLKWGTGAINIDGCRIEYTVDNPPIPQLAQQKLEIHSDNGMYGGNSYNESKTKSVIGGSLKGRFPANVIHDDSTTVLDLFPNSNSTRVNNLNNPKRGMNHVATSWNMTDGKETVDYRDSGSAARFFYCAKSSKKERGIGNNHPTVKPIALMAYLCRLVTPKGGLILDPFMGSGTTGIAANQENFNFVGIELEEDYFNIATQRLNINQKSSLLNMMGNH
jgi:DNA modification methylase